MTEIIGRNAEPDAMGSGASNESSRSAVSWPAIFCGSFAAVAMTMVLTALGAGLNLLSVSPWSNIGVNAATFGITTGIGLIVVQWLSSGLGGYLTGRLRTKWVGIHTHEVFFRDTAHGFISWALATVVVTTVLASAVSSVIGGGVHAASTVTGGAAQGIGAAAPSVSAGDVDRLFRSDRPDGTDPQAMAGQATRILGQVMTSGDVSTADRAYLAQMIATRTGISQPQAQQRVDDAIASEKAAIVKAKQIADATRKATSELAIFTALSMLIGAFISSAAAAYGGILRDDPSTEKAM